MTLEDPTYAQLQRELHHALRAQHPDWILPNGDCPTGDSYDARFAELLRQLPPTDSRALKQHNGYQFTYVLQHPSRPRTRQKIQ
jgi:hypothetical protein